MKIFKLLEKRRGHEFIERTRVNHDIDAFWGVAQDLPKIAGVTNGFCSFTSLNKLGINPSTIYPHTPNAIYAYPIDFVSELTSPSGDSKTSVHPAHSQIPFGGGRPFIQCFTVNDGATILNLSDSSECLELLRKFKKQFVGEMTDYFKERMAKIEAATYEMTVQDDQKRDCRAGKKLWWVIQVFADGNPNVWNSIFRKLGIDGVVDNGASIIHPNEPVQAVFFHKGCIKIRDVINNRKTSTDQPSGSQIPGHAEYLQFIKVIENKVILPAFEEHFNNWYSYKSELEDDINDLAEQAINAKCKNMIESRYPHLDVQITINKLIQLCLKITELMFSNLKDTIKYEEVSERPRILKQHLVNFRKYIINGLNYRFEGLIDILPDHTDED